MTYLKLSKCILSIWTQVVDLRALSKLGGLFIIYFCYLFSDPFFSTDLRLNYVWMSINTITEKTQKTFWYYLTSLIMNSTKIVFTGSIITLDMQNQIILFSFFVTGYIRTSTYLCFPKDYSQRWISFCNNKNSESTSTSRYVVLKSLKRLYAFMKRDLVC